MHRVLHPPAGAPSGAPLLAVGQAACRVQPRQAMGTAAHAAQPLPPFTAGRSSGRCPPAVTARRMRQEVGPSSSGTGRARWSSQSCSSSTVGSPCSRRSASSTAQAAGLGCLGSGERCPPPSACTLRQHQRRQASRDPGCARSHGDASLAAQGLTPTSTSASTGRTLPRHPGWLSQAQAQLERKCTWQQAAHLPGRPRAAPAAGGRREARPSCAGRAPGPPCSTAGRRRLQRPVCIRLPAELAGGHAHARTQSGRTRNCQSASSLSLLLVLLVLSSAELARSPAARRAWPLSWAALDWQTSQAGSSEPMPSTLAREGCARPCGGRAVGNGDALVPAEHDGGRAQGPIALRLGQLLVPGGLLHVKYAAAQGSASVPARSRAARGRCPAHRQLGAAGAGVLCHEEEPAAAAPGTWVHAAVSGRCGRRRAARRRRARPQRAARAGAQWPVYSPLLCCVAYGWLGSCL